MSYELPQNETKLDKQCRMQKKKNDIIQITTVRIILSIAYTKTLEIIFEAYLYIKSSDRQKIQCEAKQVAAQNLPKFAIRIF